MTTVLMFAYHFPPIAVSSGVQRTLKFSSYLPDFGWRADVVTVHPRAYERTHPGQLGEVHEQSRVHRAFALDAARHLSLFGRYPRFLATPDRWRSWLPFAVRAGLRAVRERDARCLWSTFPIATAHLAAAAVQARTGLPWVADFRDSMTEDDYPPDPEARRRLRDIEALVVRTARRSVFTTPGTLAMYAERYPELAGRFSVIENAFDDENFAQARAAPGVAPECGRKPLRIVHSGVLYPSERDPRQFFAALARLKDAGLLREGEVQFVLRATGHDRLHAESIKAAGVSDLVELAQPVPYVEALEEMLGADALMLFQATNCNHQIPAKLYEYLRAQRPVLALTDPGGDTAAVLRRERVATIVPLDDAQAIAAALPGFLARVRAGEEPVAGDAAVSRNTRRARTATLATLLDEAVSRE